MTGGKPCSRNGSSTRATVVIALASFSGGAPVRGRGCAQDTRCGAQAASAPSRRASRRGVRIRNGGQVGRPWAGIELRQERVVARQPALLADLGLCIVQVAEYDGVGRAGSLTGGHHL